MSFWGFSTPAMDAVFDADSVVSSILRFEAGLALALADVGIAPRDQAGAVAAACEENLDDPGRLLGEIWERGTPMLGIIDAIESRLSGDDERRWVHYGATTQDALDTAYMMLAREGLQILDAGLVSISRTLRDLVSKYRDQPQMGRTFLQDAEPTTFGLRVAGWLDPTLGHLERLRETSTELAVQLGGPVGTLSAYGSKATAMVDTLAKRLDLRAPDLPWHGDRSRIRTLVATVLDPVGTLAKIAKDVGLLAQSTVDEVSVRSGGSSSIPGKKNPIDVVRVVAAADVCHGAAAMIDRAGPHELDRAMGSWHVEWVALPLLFSSASAAVEATASLLESLDVHTEVMASRAGEAPRLDPALIDRVLDHCSRLA